MGSLISRRRCGRGSNVMGLGFSRLGFRAADFLGRRDPNSREMAGATASPMVVPSVGVARLAGAIEEIGREGLTAKTTTRVVQKSEGRTTGGER